MSGNVQIERIQARLAGDNIELTELGDDDGIVLYDKRLTPFGVQNACLPKRTIIDRTGEHPLAWIHWGSYEHVATAKLDLGVLFVDPRTFGVYFKPFPNKSCSQILAEFFVPSAEGEYTETRRDGLVVLNRELEDPTGQSSCTLRSEQVFDPDRGYGILSMSIEQRCTQQAPVPMMRATGEYGQIDGYWWPVHFESENLRTGYRFVYQLEHAEFDRPEHPKSIGPDDLGMPPGAPVYHPDYVDKPGESPARYLGGGKVVSKSEWEQIKSDYDVHAVQEWIRACLAKGSGQFPTWWDDASGRFGLEGVEHKPDAWEAYVRRWILKRTDSRGQSLAEPLTEKQKTAAWAVLADCRKRAHPIVEKRAAELAEARKRLRENRQVIEELRSQSKASVSNNGKQGVGGTAANPAAGGASESAGGGPKPTAREDERLAQAMQASERWLAAAKELEKPDGRLAEIFEELKRRLDGLLTSVQRSDANVLPPPAVKPQSMRDGRPVPLPQRDPRRAPPAAPRP